MAPSTASLYRTACAIPILLLLYWRRRTTDDRTAAVRRLSCASGVALAVDLIVWHHAIGLIGAGLATVLANTQVIFVGLFAWALYRERPTTMAFLTVPAVLAGVALISGLGDPDAYGTDPIGGAVFGALSGVLYAVFLLLFRASTRSLPPPEGPLLDSTIGAAVGSLALGAAFDPAFTMGVPARALGWLVALAIVSQVVGWLLITFALPRLPALETSVLLLGQPILTVLWGILLFDERLSATQWIGVAFSLGGIAALTLRGSVRAPAADR